MTPISVRSRMRVIQARGARALTLVCPRRVAVRRGGRHLVLGEDRHASHVFELCTVVYAIRAVLVLCYRVSQIGKKITKSSLPQHRRRPIPDPSPPHFQSQVITPAYLSSTPTDDGEQLTILHGKAYLSVGLFPISLSLLPLPSSSILSHHGECAPSLPSATVRARPASAFPIRVLTVPFISFSHS